jgi:hypothetical protein
MTHLSGSLRTPLNAFTHARPSRSEWRFPLCRLLCLVLPLLIFAWGTAYKLSLYKTDTGGAPAKVCTRGSDAWKNSVTQAIDGRKVIGNGAALPMLVSFPILQSGHRDVTWFESYTAILPLHSWPILAARPPPIGFLS